MGLIGSIVKHLCIPPLEDQDFWKVCLLHVELASLWDIFNCAFSPVWSVKLPRFFFAKRSLSIFHHADWNCVPSLTSPSSPSPWRENPPLPPFMPAAIFAMADAMLAMGFIPPIGPGFIGPLAKPLAAPFGATGAPLLSPFPGPRALKNFLKLHKTKHHWNKKDWKWWSLLLDKSP